MCECVASQVRLYVLCHLYLHQRRLGFLRSPSGTLCLCTAAVQLHVETVGSALKFSYTCAAIYADCALIMPLHSVAPTLVYTKVGGAHVLYYTQRFQYLCIVQYSQGNPWLGGGAAANFARHQTPFTATRSETLIL